MIISAVPPLCRPHAHETRSKLFLKGSYCIGSSLTKHLWDDVFTVNTERTCSLFPFWNFLVTWFTSQVSIVMPNNSNSGKFFAVHIFCFTKSLQRNFSFIYFLCPLFFYSLSEIQSARGIVDVLDEMLNALDHRHPEVTFL